MATRWQIGNHNWNDTAGWSTTENGGTGASFPVAGDDVKFGTGSGICTVNVSSACGTLVANANWTGTLAGSAALAVATTFTLTAGGFLTYTGALTFNGTTGTGIITSAGLIFGGTVTFNGAGGTWQLGDAFSSTSTVTHTLGTFDCNGKTFKCTTYSSAGASTRALIGAGSAWTLTGTASVINTVSTLTVTSPPDSITINNATSTGKTFAGGGKTWNDVIFTGAGSGSLTFTGAGTVIRDLTITNSNSGGVVISGTLTLRDFDATGWAGVLSGASSVTCTGNWKYDTTNGTPTWNGTLTFAGSSGTQAITSNGKTFAGAVTINNPGATASLVGAFLCSSVFTVTAGTFTSNSNTMSSTTFISTASNTRNITLDSTAYTCTGTGTVVNIQGTGLTFSMVGGAFTANNASASAKTVQVTIAITLGDLSFTGAGTGTLAIIGNDSTPPTFRDIFVANTGGAGFSIASGIVNARDWDFTGYTGVWSATRVGGCSRNFTLGATMAAITCSGTITFNGTSGTQTITSNGVAFGAMSPTINNAGATCSLADALSTTGTVTVTAGTLTTNGKALTCFKFSSTNTNVRSITIDNSTVIVTRPSSIAWDLTISTNLSLSTTNSEIQLTGLTTGATAQFVGGGLVYNDLTLTAVGPITSGSYSVKGSNTFHKLAITGTGAQRCLFNDGDTQTITSRFVAQGTAGNIITLGSILGGSAFLSKASGVMSEMDYLALAGGLCVTGGALWFAGQHSTAANDNNKGWYVTSAPPRPGVLAVA